MSITIPYSEACERNKDPIFNCIAPILNNVQSVLEVGSGTAQHAIHFARHLPHLFWQTSDRAEYLPGIIAQLNNAAVDNVLPPRELDVNQSPWFDDGRVFDAVFTANTFHIMCKVDIEQFFCQLPKVMAHDFYLLVYGPFKYQAAFTSQSNAEFDQRLRARGEGSAIRDFEWLDSLAQRAGLRLIEDRPMPANNQCLIWHKTH